MLSILSSECGKTIGEGACAEFSALLLEGAVQAAMRDDRADCLHGGDLDGRLRELARVDGVPIEPIIVAAAKEPLVLGCPRASLALMLVDLRRVVQVRANSTNLERGALAVTKLGRLALLRPGALDLRDFLWGDLQALSVELLKKALLFLQRFQHFVVVKIVIVVVRLVSA